ncbi:hypothetical protein DI272_00295 [Streptomyces sp. Act143]|nr:hypothetical protein DI272_00295 [Streptomyces sp. Act143]
MAWQLIDAGPEVELACGDWEVGDSLLANVSAALARGGTLTLCSPAYFDSGPLTMSGVVRDAGPGERFVGV